MKLAFKLIVVFLACVLTGVGVLGGSILFVMGIIWLIEHTKTSIAVVIGICFVCTVTGYSLIDGWVHRYLN